MTFVPPDFEVPTVVEGPGVRLEPLGPEHNERDHAAWMSSIEHIHATPGFDDPDDWPQPMSRDENLGDLRGHREDFEARTGFTYSVLDGDDVVGCVYVYPSSEDGVDAHLRSWVTAERRELDRPLSAFLTRWVREEWPFEVVRDFPRPPDEAS